MDRKIEKKKWPPKKIALFAGGGLFFLFVIYSFIFGDSSSKLNVETEKITIATVARGPFQEFIPVTGSVLPIKTIYIDAIEGGRVEKKFIEAGTLVKEGDPILLLANTNMLLDIMFREAQFFEQSNNLRNTRLLMEQSRLNLRQQLNDQEYQLQRLKRLYERAEELRTRNLISQQDFEQTRDEYEYRRKQKELSVESFKQDSLFRQIQVEQLESSLRRMQHNLDVTKQRLESMTIKAPVTGQLTSLNAEIGESKAPGQRLGQVDVLDGFKVRAGIDEHYLPRISLDLAGEFDFANQTYKLIVKKYIRKFVTALRRRYGIQGRRAARHPARPDAAHSLAARRSLRSGSAAARRLLSKPAGNGSTWSTRTAHSPPTRHQVGPAKSANV
jgi:HlyD family secretion protein